MILTCPACATQYTIKDGAIPPEGRKVRCASCKHSWHQEADGTAPSGEALERDQAMAESAIAPPPPEPTGAEAPLAEIPGEAVADGMIAEEPQPEVDEIPASDVPAEGLDPYAPPPEALEVPTDNETYESFAAIPAMHDEEDEPSRGRTIGWVIGLVLLVIAAAAAIWYFMPAEYRAQFGIAEEGASPLELMLTTSDRQRLASGNELLAISGRIINPTDREQAVPPIEAELRNKTTKKLVYKWTIAPPARSLPPRGSASFNSAEVDIPAGGDELTVTLGGKPG